MLNPKIRNSEFGVGMGEISTLWAHPFISKLILSPSSQSYSCHCKILRRCHKVYYDILKFCLLISGSQQLTNNMLLTDLVIYFIQAIQKKTLFAKNRMGKNVVTRAAGKSFFRKFCHVYMTSVRELLTSKDEWMQVPYVFSTTQTLNICFTRNYIWL